MKEMHAMWVPREGRGLEHLRLVEDGESILADGVIVGEAGGIPFRARYRIRCDAEWRVRKLSLDPLDGKDGVELRAHGEGSWKDAGGERVPLLDGCIDVDLSATPFTNTLPIRRLNLEAGEAAEIVVVYVDIPHLQVTASRQRYACLESGRLYAFESLDVGFAAELQVDSRGLVLEYPGLFRRVY